MPREAGAATSAREGGPLTHLTRAAYIVEWLGASGS